MFMCDKNETLYKGTQENGKYLNNDITWIKVDLLSAGFHSVMKTPFNLKTYRN